MAEAEYADEAAANPPVHNHAVGPVETLLDLHVVNGPGGGHTFSHASPGESASFKFTAMNNPHFNVQTTLVPAGGAVMTEFKVDVPGRYLIVDHSLSRLYKGAVEEIIVTGPENSDIYGPLP